jgi:hypothetical protein
MPTDATEFRKLVADFETEEHRKQEEERRAAAKLRSDQVKVLIGEHITGKRWRELLRRAREAAAHGMTDFMLLHFPHNLCSDGGRSINALAENDNWPETLRGEAGGGVPGDIGLFFAGVNERGVSWPTRRAFTFGCGARQGACRPHGPARDPSLRTVGGVWVGNGSILMASSNSRMETKADMGQRPQVVAF